MNASREYDTSLVEVSFQQEKRGKWDWQGNKVAGSEHYYEVRDGNFDRLNKWIFWVRVPTKLGPILVGPHQLPSRSTFAGLERRTVVFTPANCPGHRSEYYCKVFLSDPTGERNRRGISKDDRGLLPPWFSQLTRILRLKCTVATTKGTDGRSLVVVVAPDDHQRMIRVYFAMRVWVLSEKWVINA